MSLFTLPVTAAEIAQLETGIQFRQSSAANQQLVADAINAPNSTQTVFTYAATLLNANIATSQVAMATSSLMWGATQPTNFLTNTATVAAPLFVALAGQIGTNAVTTSAEGVGVALANDAKFAPFLALNATDFAGAVAGATGVNVS